MANLIKVGVLGLFLLSGCATLTVQTDYETGFDFQALKTYAWLEDKAPSNDIRINNDLIINRVVNAVNQNLQARGYILTDRDKADFYVNWFGGIENRIQQQTINTYYGHLGYDSLNWGHGGYWPNDFMSYTYEYQEGTLIIDIVDSKSKQLIWRGTVRGSLYNNNLPEKITARINRSVTGILKNFPPGTKR